MKRTTQPTLEDVARASKVSTATISRALNDPEKVAKDTLDKIREAIDTLGYTPNFGGRILASNRSNTVGAIIPTMANAMFAGGLQAFQEVLAEAGVTMLVASTGYNSENELLQIRSLMAHGADGLLLIGSERPEKTKQFLDLRGVPCVISWCYLDDPSRIFVGFDNYKAAQNMARRVLEHGHRKIAMIAGFTKDNDRARNRHDGVRDAIRHFGDGANLLTVVEADYRIADGARAFDEILACQTRPTAVVCGNDVLAAGAIVRARERGFSVPEDISVTGFDDIALASVVQPTLTTVRVPQLEMGRLAARHLLDLVSGKASVSSVELGTDIVMRGSLVGPKN